MNLEVTSFAGSSTIGGGFEATTSPSSTSIGGCCFGTTKGPTSVAIVLPSVTRARAEGGGALLRFATSYFLGTSP